MLASSVDAERAFSGGRLQVNHLQHGISSQTFKARVALGSWVDTPLFPPSLAPEILRSKLESTKSKKSNLKLTGSEGKGKGKEKAVIVLDSDSE